MGQKLEFDDHDDDDKKGINAFIKPVVAAMVAGFIIFLPKIYIANSIYLESLKLERSRNTLDILQDEHNKLIRAKQRAIFKYEQLGENDE
ncbi:MAG: hypothetical protein LBN32_04400 [Helicobacteraceae bacterium]|jgi:hypothetical protein|nr:hypothetical protein [Helicobacteraceae bacterium]